MNRQWWTFRDAAGKDLAKLAADHAYVWTEALAMAQRLANSGSEDVYVSGRGLSKRVTPEHNGGQL